MIPSYINYIFKINIAIVVFYFFYRFFLKNDTFYAHNRIYLIAALIIAVIFPNIDSSLFYSQTKALVAVNPINDLNMILTGRNDQLLFVHYLSIIIALVSLILLIRLLIQIISLIFKYKSLDKIVLFNTNVVRINERVNPFSFFNWIFINPKLHDEGTVGYILAHESIHIKQYHTVDILLYELATICFWYNPCVWLMRRMMKQNIEFLADREIIKLGYNKRQYQYNLIKTSQIPVLTDFVNNFIFNDLKKRIIMMNKKPTANINLLKFLLILPVLGLTTLFVNANPIKKDGELFDKQEKTVDSTKNNQDIKVIASEQIEGASIVFDKDVHDFGTINEADGIATALFTFTNNGNNPLVINSVSASCGCTVPEWTKDPVAPKGVGYIRVLYDPRGRIHPFDKSVTVFSNANTNRVTLHIKGTVVKN